MARPEKPVDVSGGPAAQFASELRQLREGAGGPTYRDMARHALYSASVLSSAASGYRLPTLQVTLAYVRACGGDLEEWRRRWLRAQRLDSGLANEPAERRLRPVPASVQLLPLPSPAQLPLRARVFTGRHAELSHLAEGSAAGPVVISGPAGIGKSELALAYAHRLAQDMTDGQLHADLGDYPVLPGLSFSTDQEALINGFLHALGIPQHQLPVTPGQRIGLYRSILAKRRILVLLENACCETQVRPLLAESRLSMTIVVSRSPLLGLSGVRRVCLGLLPRADSIAHIATILRQRAVQDRAACDQLAARCADLPLALDIATRKLAARPELPLRQAIDRLREPDAGLDWLRVGDLSVRETLDEVYAQLDEAARALLGRLARPGDGRASGWPRRPLAAPPGEEDCYEQLAVAGMLRRGEPQGTYRIDPLVGAYVSDLARHPGVPTYGLATLRVLPFHPPHTRPVPVSASPALSGIDRHVLPTLPVNRYASFTGKSGNLTRDGSLAGRRAACRDRAAKAEPR